MRIRHCFGVLFAMIAVHAAAAQVRPGVFGFQVSGLNGVGGEFCHVFDCTPRLFTAVNGETLTFHVNAPLQAPYLVAASLTATSCLPLPFLVNDLILDGTIVTLAVGVVSTGSPILACWGGTEPLTLPLAGLPSGLSFATQAFAVVPTTSGADAAASVAIITTIQ